MVGDVIVKSLRCTGTVVTLSAVAALMLAGCGQSDGESGAAAEPVSNQTSETVNETAAPAARSAAADGEADSEAAAADAASAGGSGAEMRESAEDLADSASDAAVALAEAGDDEMKTGSNDPSGNAAGNRSAPAGEREDGSGSADEAGEAESGGSGMATSSNASRSTTPTRSSSTSVFDGDRSALIDRSKADPDAGAAVDTSTTMHGLKTSREAGKTHDPVDLTAATITVEPASIELGDIPTNDAKTGVVTITNTGEEPQTLIRCQTSCGCTTTNCPTGQVIAAGESVEVDVKMTSGPRPRSLHKVVTFLFSDHKPVQVPVKANAVAFVNVEPARISPEQIPDGKITLTSTDKTPFTIKNMHPALVTEFSEEAAVSHTVEIPWDLWEELGQSRRLVFNVDHPKTGQVIANVIVRKVSKPQPTANQNADSDLASGDFSALFDAGRGSEVVSKVQSGELDVNARTAKGQTPLMVAAFKGDYAATEALLDASADIAATDNLGCTALMFAARSKNSDCVRALLDAGADISMRDRIGNTALSWAAAFGTATSVQMLIDEGADVGVVGKITGFTPAIWAAGFGEAESLQAIIDAGADLEARDLVQGNTPLMHAVQTGSVENVRILIDEGVDLEAVNNQGRTALLVGASVTGADAPTMKQLIDAGANLAAKDYQGKNALDLARTRADVRSQAVIALLEQHMSESAKDGDAPADEESE